MKRILMLLLLMILPIVLCSCLGNEPAVESKNEVRNILFGEYFVFVKRWLFEETQENIDEAVASLIIEEGKFSIERLSDDNELFELAPILNCNQGGYEILFYDGISLDTPVDMLVKNEISVIGIITFQGKEPEKKTCESANIYFDSRELTISLETPWSQISTWSIKKEYP